MSEAESKAILEPANLHALYPAWRLWSPSAALVAVLILASYFSPAPPVGPDMPHFDKIAHFFVFGLLGTHLFRAQRIEFLNFKRFVVAVAGVVLYGLIDEFLQSLNPNRSFDPYDWIANFSGALLAVSLYRNWSWYRNLLEKRFFRKSA